MACKVLSDVISTAFGRKLAILIFDGLWNGYWVGPPELLARLGLRTHYGPPSDNEMS